MVELLKNQCMSNICENVSLFHVYQLLQAALVFLYVLLHPLLAHSVCFEADQH